MDKGTKVAVIVLNWNGLNDTIECVESLKKTTYPDKEIIIVDNGSSDGSEQALRKKFPGIRLIQTGRNLGFAGGENAGMRDALSRGADYLLLINNDATVDPNFITALVEAAKTNPDAGILCSKVYFHSRPDVIWYAGASYHPWLGWGRHRGYNKKDTGRFDRMEPTQRACGCSLMATRGFCEKTGLFDEKYFCYCEDTDWSMRAKKAGFQVLYVPASRVWHKVARSTGGIMTATSLYYFVRNSLKCVNDNAPLPFILRHVRYVLILITSVMSLFTMSVPKSTGIKRIYQGFIDYFKGKTGEFRNS